MALAVCAASCFIYLRRSHFPPIGTDDANIFFVYAKHLVEGRGFVYNVGGEHVEGFSSLLWTLICAVFYWLTPHFERFLLILNFLLVVATLFRLSEFLGDCLHNKSRMPFYWLAILIVPVFFAGFYDWTVLSLQESGLWTFLITSMFIDTCCYLENRGKKHLWILTLVCFLALLTRPEAPAWIFLIFLFLLLDGSWKVENKIAVWKRLRPFVFWMTLSVIGLEIFRLAYFGYPLPNTFYAKVSRNLWMNLKAGLGYSVRYLWLNKLLFVPMTISGWAIWRLAPKIRSGISSRVEKAQLVGAVFIVWNFLMITFIGGDHFYLFRMFQPLLPLMLFVILSWLAGCLAGKSKGVKIVSAIIAVPIVVFVPYNNLPRLLQPGGLRIEYDIAAHCRDLGNTLNRFFSQPELPSVGILAAGGFGFTYKGVMIDLLGLNNTRMAHALPDKVGWRDHASFDPATFLELRPDLMAPERVTECLGGYQVYREDEITKGIFHTPPFQALYSAACITNRAQNVSLAAWVRKDYLKSLPQDRFAVQIFE